MTDVSQLTQYQVLRLVEETTGTRVTLGRYEKVRACHVEESRVCLTLNRVKYRESARSDKILYEGMTVYEWRLIDGHWHSLLPMTSWWEPGVDYVEHVPGHTADEQQESYRWAVMCERPGSAKYPMDWMQSCRPLEY